MAERFPLKEAYVFLKNKNLSKEAEEIRQSEGKVKNSTTMYRRVRMISFFENNNLLDEFIKFHWQHGKTAEGQKELDRHRNINIGAEKQPLSFDEEVHKSRADSSEDRKKRLKKARKKPETILVNNVAYIRNPDVVAEVLENAKGVCEVCNKPAPFKRKKDSTPYLEVHHKKQLADGGEDTVENAEALCPNCHREKHFG